MEGEPGGEQLPWPSQSPHVGEWGQNASSTEARTNRQMMLTTPNAEAAQNRGNAPPAHRPARTKSRHTAPTTEANTTRIEDTSHPPPPQHPQHNVPHAQKCTQTLMTTLFQILPRTGRNMLTSLEFCSKKRKSRHGRTKSRHTENKSILGPTIRFKRTIKV
jgi:hypothetical protein